MAKRILMILYIGIIFFMAAEASLRICGLFDKNRGLKNCMGEPNKKYHHAFKPNSSFRLIAPKNNEYSVFIRINNYGFRGEDIALSKKPGTIRILAMGDSFLFGVGAEEDETIPYLVEKYLKERGGNVEVINAGIGGSSPLSNYLKARDEYLEFEPDIVLYFFDFSDLADDWRNEKSLVYDKSGNILRCDPTYAYGKRDWWAFMRLHSKACSFIHNKFVRLFDKIRILGLRGYIRAKLEGKRAKALIVAKKGEMAKDPIEYDGYLMIRGRDKLPQVKVHFKRCEKYLNMIRDLFRERGTPMILVVYPYGIHVGPDMWSEGRVYWGFEKGKIYDDYYAFDILEDYAKRSNIPCINLLPDLLKARDEHLFFDLDGHFTPTANKIAAKAIASNPLILKKLQ
ncbi:MAG: hypothetical protein NTW09_05720 [Candidatus Omnitrophica bacterium]|nr:hypothetical protein [Candidatus Omnitrophota bacterium]